MPKRTPLYKQHLALGARCIDFGGWEMPVQYTGIVAEHQAVRTAAGVFDISHMGEIWVGGAHDHSGDPTARLGRAEAEAGVATRSGAGEGGRKLGR